MSRFPGSRFPNFQKSGLGRAWGLERKAATQVREFEKLAFAYFALVSLTSVHKIQKMDGPWNFWKPLTADYVAAGAFFLEKLPSYFWKPLTCGYVAAGASFLQRNGPHISGST